jgi:hypothetical protein
MGVPLTTLTQQPVRYDTFHFGGDDTSLGRSGFFGTIAQWDLNAQDDCFKANFVFFIKKAFAFLDQIGIGTCFFGFEGFTGKIEDCQLYQTGPDRNRQARERIVTALGGEVACRSFRVVRLHSGDFTHYLKLGDGYFDRGESTVQGEDPAGRKFIAMRLADRAGRVAIATIHQRYRETTILSYGHGDGSMWTTNFNGGIEHVQPDTNHSVEFIQKVLGHRHELFTLAPKP